MCSGKRARRRRPSPKTSSDGLPRASDGIRTRVDGFAGRCLATQPHPRRDMTMPARPAPAPRLDPVIATASIGTPTAFNTLRPTRLASPPTSPAGHTASGRGTDSPARSGQGRAHTPNRCGRPRRRGAGTRWRRDSHRAGRRRSTRRRAARRATCSCTRSAPASGPASRGSRR